MYFCRAGALQFPPYISVPLNSMENTDTKRSHLDQVLDGYVQQNGVFVTICCFPLLLLTPYIFSVMRWGIGGPTDGIVDHHVTFAASRNHPPASLNGKETA